jgi:hypothetical protein
MLCEIWGSKGVSAFARLHGLVCLTRPFPLTHNLGTPKAFQTSANPGMTQALSTRLKLSLDPLVYAYDSPGVMLPFLGRYMEGAERGVKLALIGM